MKAFIDLKEMLEDELKKIVKKGDITPQELESAYKAMDILKDIETIKAMQEQSEDGGYSQRGGRGGYRGYEMMYDGPIWNRNANDGSYDGGEYARDGGEASYRRGRDARGRYTSRDGNPGEMGSYDGGEASYRGNGGYANRGYAGYSRDAAEMVQRLHKMMQEAGSEKERKAIQQCIEKLES